MLIGWLHTSSSLSLCISTPAANSVYKSSLWGANGAPLMGFRYHQGSGIAQSGGDSGETLSLSTCLKGGCFEVGVGLCSHVTKGNASSYTRGDWGWTLRKICSVLEGYAEQSVFRNRKQIGTKCDRKKSSRRSGGPGAPLSEASPDSKRMPGM